MILGTNNNTSAETVGANGVINLSKGGKINLSKKTPGLKKIMVGLGWQCNYSGGDDFDLDASVFMVDKNGRSSEAGFIFYNNLHGPNDSVIHQGDNRVGGDGGDDEQIYIDLDLVPDNIEKIAITITIDGVEQGKKHQNFGMVSNAYCRLVNNETDKEEIRFNLAEDYSVETALVVGELYKHDGDWKFSAVGQGFAGGLMALCRNYGLVSEYK